MKKSFTIILTGFIALSQLSAAISAHHKSCIDGLRHCGRVITRACHAADNDNYDNTCDYHLYVCGEGCGIDDMDWDGDGVCDICKTKFDHCDKDVDGVCDYCLDQCSSVSGNDTVLSRQDNVYSSYAYGNGCGGHHSGNHHGCR